jgi:hypothetical protein
VTPTHKARSTPKVSHKKQAPDSASKRQRDAGSSDNDDAAAAVATKSSSHKTKSMTNKPTQAELHALQRQEMSSIMQSITKDGFELKHVEPDGSCLFRALSLQLVASDSSWTARKLRQSAAEHLEAHESEYVHFVDDSLGSFKECVAAAARAARFPHWLQVLSPHQRLTLGQRYRDTGTVQGHWVQRSSLQCRAHHMAAPPSPPLAAHHPPPLTLTPPPPPLQVSSRHRGRNPV